MFGLDKHDASITNLNLRKELHGEDKKPACDISFSIGASALLLDDVDKKLRPAFFEKPAKGEQQALPIDGNNLTKLTLPYLKEQKLAREFEGYEVSIGDLLDHAEPLFFADAKVKLERVTFIDGGSIELSFKVSSLFDRDDQDALLAAWLRGEVKLSLVPPSKVGDSSADNQKAA